MSSETGLASIEDIQQYATRIANEFYKAEHVEWRLQDDRETGVQYAQFTVYLTEDARDEASFNELLTYVNQLTSSTDFWNTPKSFHHPVVITMNKPVANAEDWHGESTF